MLDRIRGRIIRNAEDRAYASNGCQTPYRLPDRYRQTVLPAFVLFTLALIGALGMR